MTTRRRTIPPPPIHSPIITEPPVPGRPVSAFTVSPDWAWWCETISGQFGKVEITKADSPASTTDNRLVRFDGTNGAIQSTGITADDSDNLSGIGDITLTGTVDGRDVATDGTKLDGI